MLVGTRWHGRGDSVADNITLWFKQDTFHNKIVIVFIGNYYFQIGKFVLTVELNKKKIKKMINKKLRSKLTS